jgi:hypothetical protein
VIWSLCFSRSAPFLSKGPLVFVAHSYFILTQVSTMQTTRAALTDMVETRPQKKDIDGLSNAAAVQIFSGLSCITLQVRSIQNNKRYSAALSTPAGLRPSGKFLTDRSCTLFNMPRRYFCWSIITTRTRASNTTETRFSHLPLDLLASSLAFSDVLPVLPGNGSSKRTLLSFSPLRAYISTCCFVLTGLLF